VGTTCLAPEEWGNYTFTHGHREQVKNLQGKKKFTGLFVTVFTWSIFIVNGVEAKLVGSCAVFVMNPTTTSSDHEAES
jgi:hypothetical protein